MLGTYYQLAKPGIVYGNALPTIAAFLFASQRHVVLGRFVATILGSSLVIASACVCNNYIDRGIDRAMTRTRKRALVEGSISGRQALSYASVLGIVGFAILTGYTNWLTVLAAVIGLIAYVVVYGVAKRRTIHSTLIGSISGAMPPVIGYVAAADRLDRSAIVLFLMLVFWQMPHFYAIALYRSKDYAEAKLPLLALKKPSAVTKLHINVYATAFTLSCLALALFCGAGWLYGVAALFLCLSWQWKCLSGFWQPNTAKWARGVFYDSLSVLTLLCVMIGLSPWLV